MHSSDSNTVSDRDSEPTHSRQIKTRSDLRITLGLIHNANETREAPWYGVWDIVLQHHLFPNRISHSAVSMTMPQYPLVRGLDVIDDWNDEDHPKEGANEDDPQEGVDNEDTSNNANGSSAEPDNWPFRKTKPIFPQSTLLTDRLKTPPPSQRSALPSGSSDPLNIGRHIPPMISRASPESPTLHVMRSISQARAVALPIHPSQPTKRSTRIPDFGQLLHTYCERRLGVEDLNISKTRIIALVEIKPASFDVDMSQVYWLFDRARRQVREQAHHAFAMDPTLNQFGTFLCIGSRWTYIQHHRSDLTPSPPTSQRDDPTYTDTSSPTPSEDILASFPAPFLQSIFKENAWLVLQDPDGRSDEAFACILDKIRDDNRDMWTDACPF